jgi:hypothetical protein
MLECRLLECKTAYVGLLGLGIFEVLRHEADNKYVVRGPNNVAEERKVTMIVDAAAITIQPYGAPVVCDGLKNKAAYLNGKIGEIWSIDETT